MSSSFFPLLLLGSSVDDATVALQRELIGFRCQDSTTPPATEIGSALCRPYSGAHDEQNPAVTAAHLIGSQMLIAKAASFIEKEIDISYERCLWPQKNGQFNRKKETTFL